MAEDREEGLTLAILDVADIDREGSGALLKLLDPAS